MDCSMPGLPCPSPSPWVCSNSGPLSWWCYPTISSVIPFSCPQSLCMFFSKELALHIRWPKDWSFSFSISPFNEYSGLISSRIDWFDLPAVQGTSLTHSSKASVLHRSAFFMVQLSLSYMTTGKTMALTIQIFVSKVMFMVFNTLSRLVIFLSNEQESFNFKASVTINSDFRAQEYKIYHYCNCFPFYLPWSDGTGYHDLSFLNAEFQASFFTLLFTFIKRLFSSFLLSAIKLVSSACLRLLIFLLEILILAYDSSSSAFLMMYSA